jgi:hypothetical protein
VKFLICMIFGHTEWRPEALRDFSFIEVTDKEAKEQWEVCLCRRCKLLYWKWKRR